MTYRAILLTAHIFFAIVLLGPLVYNGLFLPQLIRGGRNNIPMLRFSERAEALAGRASAIVFLLGIWLVLRDSHDRLTFGKPWISVAMVLFIIASVIGAVGVAGVVRKAIEKIEAGEDTKAEAARAALYGLINFAILLVIVYLMVRKPGG